MAADTAFKNAQQNSDRENTRVEYDKVLLRVITAVMKDDSELFRSTWTTTAFKRWLSDTVFDIAYERAEAA